ncbi:MAG: hypothetical protein L6Q99_01520 [Planctomycetes bacterium]|nr:hypothetical protein [Planctomycetota bacterium]
MLGIESTRREAAGDVSWFDARGELHCFCARGNPPRTVSLTWRSSDGVLVTCASGDGRWAGQFPAGRYVLVDADGEHGRLVPSSPTAVSSSESAPDVWLRCEDAYVVDVRDGSSGRRIDRATIRPTSGHDGSSVTTSSTLTVRKERDRTITEVIASDPPAAWVLEYANVPVVLPSPPKHGSVTLSSAGFRDGRLDGVDAPGWYVATLEPQRSLRLRLEGAARSTQTYLIEIEFASGRAVALERLRPPDERSVEIVNEAEATIVISPTTRIGRGPVLFERTVALGTHSEVVVTEADLARSAAIASGAVEIEVELPATVAQQLGQVTLELRPVRVGVGLGRFDEPRDSVKRWPVGAASSHVQRFDGLRTGEYRAVLQPVGIEKHVHVEAGAVAQVRFDVTPLAEVRLWPVTASGSPVAEPHALGQVLWSYCDDTALAERAANSALVNSSDAEAELGVGLQLGTVHLAECVDGGWSFVATPSRRIRVSFVGARALQVEPREIELMAGTNDETLRFAGL